MQKHVNLVDLVKSFPTNIYLQNLASIQKRTSPVKFVHLAEKSGKGSISNLSTKLRLGQRGEEARHDEVDDDHPREAHADEEAVENHPWGLQACQTVPGGSGLAESGQILQGSFSAVSKPNFASKY